MSPTRLGCWETHLPLIATRPWCLTQSRCLVNGQRGAPELSQWPPSFSSLQYHISRPGPKFSTPTLETSKSSLVTLYGPTFSSGTRNFLLASGSVLGRGQYNTSSSEGSSEGGASSLLSITPPALKEEG